MLKAVILIGGPQKGTRFRPLSLQVPKPLFPVAGRPVIQHHIEACAAVPGLREVLLLGVYPAGELQPFAAEMAQRYGVSVRYLQEYAALGTAGGLFQFRDQIRAGGPAAFFVLNGDVCGDFRLDGLLAFHTSRPPGALLTVMATEATRQQSINFGCIAEDRTTHAVLHYVEKPETFVSTLINTGIYICSVDIFQEIGAVFKRKQEELYSSDYDENGAASGEAISLEEDILAPLAGTGRAFVYQTARWWSQIKTASAALYSNRHYLKLYRESGVPLAEDGKPCKIIGDVWIHPTATIHPTAVLGPNVSVGRNAEVGAGVRIREAIVLGSARVRDHSLVLHAVLGWDSLVGAWSRIEGTPCDPDPNKPFAKMDNVPLFSEDGKLNPSITILGSNVSVAPEKIVLNCIILPHKELLRSYKNEILL